MEQGTWRDFFHFSKSEKQGVIALSVLCIASAAWSICWPEYLSRREIAAFEQEFSGLLAELRQDTSTTSIPRKNTAVPQVGTAPQQSTTTAQNRYERVPSTPRKTTAKAASRQVLTDHPLHVNTAEADALKQNGRLPAVLCYRLVRYRNELGGFAVVEQLKEVYEMTDSIYALILPYVVWEAVPFARLNANTASSDELMKHPYIHKGLAAQIVNYREKVSGYSRAEDLLKLYFMDDALLAKLRPYLDF